MALTDEAEQSLESVVESDPDLTQIQNELRQSNADAWAYSDRVSMLRGWWLCEWPHQTPDGRKWAPEGGDPKQVFPWNGCSDSRLRIVSTIVQEHVSLALTAFWSAKVQSKSIRQFASAREASITQRMLNWCVYTQMRRELLRELPLAYSWKYGYGLSFIAVEWEQQRATLEVPIALDMLSGLTQTLGLPDITSKIMDPDKRFDKDLVTVLQGLSPILPTADARNILNNLRTTGQAQLPIVNLRINKPKWTACRPFYDVWFPSETSELQSARWTARRELVSETELSDRIVTDGYDPKFVDLAIQKKGQFMGIIPAGNQLTAIGSDRDMVELFHFRMRYLENGVPCMYKTIFCDACVGDGLYAVHRKDEYEHQQYPFVALRRNTVFRPLLSSMGIAEEAYTDELDLKKQQDGLNDRTDLIHQPPMIVPTLRAQATAQAYGPRAIMTSLRPDVVTFPPLPPMDQTPVAVMEMVQQRLDRRYGIYGVDIDPQMKSIRIQQLANDVLGELELALEQTLQLGQQYWTQQDVQTVAGDGSTWQYNQKEIQMQATVTATVDMSLVDKDMAQAKLNMLAQIMPFKDAGGMVFNAAANIVDPDLADALSQSQMSPQALKQETDDEYNSWGQIMSGMVPQKPQMANNQLRLQTCQQIMMQPNVQQYLAQDPTKQKIAADRVQYFQNQIQQFQMNPQIGRTLTTQPFTNNQPAVMTNAQASAQAP